MKYFTRSKQWQQNEAVRRSQLKRYTHERSKVNVRSKEKVMLGHPFKTFRVQERRIFNSLFANFCGCNKIKASSTNIHHDDVQKLSKLIDTCNKRLVQMIKQNGAFLEQGLRYLKKTETAAATKRSRN
jgi:hypothetical protein